MTFTSVSNELHLKQTGIFTAHEHGFVAAVAIWALLRPSVWAMILALMMAYIGKKIFQYIANDDPIEPWVPCCENFDLVDVKDHLNMERCLNCDTFTQCGGKNESDINSTRSTLSHCCYEWVRIASLIIMVGTCYVFHFFIGVVVTAKYLEMTSEWISN